MSNYNDYPPAQYSRPKKPQGNMADDIVDKDIDDALEMMLRGESNTLGEAYQAVQNKKRKNSNNYHSNKRNTFHEPEPIERKEIRLEDNHRYGTVDEVLRAKFVKTPEEMEKERFQLLLASRSLHRSIMRCCESIPKVEKYVLGGAMRASSLNILKFAIHIKKKYYRRNLLENMDVELECLREYFYHAQADYPEWCTRNILEYVFADINKVGSLVGGLIKATVV